MNFEENKDLIRKIIKEQRYTKLDINLEKNNSVKIYMRPINVNDLEDKTILNKLTDWRNKNMESFFTKFDATPERTKKWLENTIMINNSQLIFLIFIDDNVIGHLGFKLIDDGNIMLDNAIRGERGGPANLFIVAHKTLIKWIFLTFKNDLIRGYVMADNPSAIMMNKNVGWEEWRKLPLILEKNIRETKWSIGRFGDKSKENKYCYELLIKK